MKDIIVLGSTGSIGANTLDVVRRNPHRLRIVGLGAGLNLALLRAQVREFTPASVAIRDTASEWALRQEFPSLTVFSGESGVVDLVRESQAEVVVAATSGMAGLPAVFAAAEQGVRLALANKEALVATGPLLLEAVRRHGGELVPVDSEHSAIWQALRGWCASDVKRLILTASGGPFLGKPRSLLATQTSNDALRHPTWRMGRKITVDSATLMNKGLEIIEAHHLFNISYEHIEVLVHPESIVHSMVEFIDGSQLAQCSRPDMRIPIQLALSYPERWSGDYVLNNWQNTTWSFHLPDVETFRCLPLAIAAGRAGGSHPIVLNASNELAVDAFLAGRVPFLAIEAIVEEAMSASLPSPPQDVLDVLEVDTWARNQAQAIIRQKAVY
ncbi:MAG: 1-deoxy-D-xylulose 5-phosphate reductoisomerase [Firmicutes bacterium]|nr:1-deoxy-D-xylulose 5-phosphate reductoisomerase [candidate division NPL-UPA2 bacterium]